MVHSHGYRCGTREVFSKKFGTSGTTPTSHFMHVFKLGDVVDVKADSGIQRGMPHKFYHGKTGRVWNITPRGVGVIVNKRVRQRIIPKKILVRVEHVRPSKCTEFHKKRVKENEALKLKAKETHVRYQLKRKPAGPRGGRIICAKKTTIETLRPVPYEILL
uniref:60S ribosomal protein L21-1 n=1 Tax=Stygiella incarcerata TaxID=1712417 RepID=A0A192ZIF8_9EUKA|nr:60S ribosomal protein L21-1 [Stygiella incarcerata]|eukprot:TRINITY_DN1231_c0_g2_i1.p2 TRINITY_DN1231_c0_g2~~TRINITY_DN1231_c0_g2_i1.p2  ORF type:complete len:161 (+),score=31.98 TRINITY_DN1231_c0_g2_i1:107-589(+)